MSSVDVIPFKTDLEHYKGTKIADGDNIGFRSHPNTANYVLLSAIRVSLPSGPDEITVTYNVQTGNDTRYPAYAITRKVKTNGDWFKFGGGQNHFNEDGVLVDLGDLKSPHERDIYSAWKTWFTIEGLGDTQLDGEIERVQYTLTGKI